jgi:hypothetical protein
MDYSDAQRLMALKEENRKLKPLPAERQVEVQMLRSALSNDGLTPVGFANDVTAGLPISVDERTDEVAKSATSTPP